jgi:hypothetical protein
MCSTLLLTNRWKCHGSSHWREFTNWPGREFSKTYLSLKGSYHPGKSLSMWKGDARWPQKTENRKKYNFHSQKMFYLKINGNSLHQNVSTRNKPQHQTMSARNKPMHQTVSTWKKPKHQNVSTQNKFHFVLVRLVLCWGLFRVDTIWCWRLLWVDTVWYRGLFREGTFWCRLLPEIFRFF